MTPNRASDATMVKSEPGPSLVELYVNEAFLLWNWIQ